MCCIARLLPVILSLSIAISGSPTLARDESSADAPTVYEVTVDESTAYNPTIDRPTEHDSMTTDKPSTYESTADTSTPYQPKSDESMGIRIYNNNSLTQYISADWAAKDFKNPSPLLEWGYAATKPGEQIFIRAPSHSSPKFFVGPTTNNRTAEVGNKRDRDTVIEATFNDMYHFTWYDVDIEKGFSVPVWCHGEGDDWETGQGCTADLLPHCPEEQKHYDNATGLYDQCVANDSEEHYRMRATLCPKVYVKWNDDKNSAIPKHVVVCTIIDTQTARLQSLMYKHAELEKSNAAFKKAHAALKRKCRPH